MPLSSRSRLLLATLCFFAGEKYSPAPCFEGLTRRDALVILPPAASGKHAAYSKLDARQHRNDSRSEGGVSAISLQGFSSLGLLFSSRVVSKKSSSLKRGQQPTDSFDVHQNLKGQPPLPAIDPQLSSSRSEWLMLALFLACWNGQGLKGYNRDFGANSGTRKNTIEK